jgi:hypothetical protein
MINSKTPKIRIPISNEQVKASIRMGLNDVKRYLVSNRGDSSGIIKKQMLESKTGRVYPIIRKGKRIFVNHQASNASGQESSARLSGRLMNSIVGEVQASDSLIISARTPYAKIQEERSNNFRRPILSNRGKIKNMIGRAVVMRTIK